jgi:hypothetical protein
VLFQAAYRGGSPNLTERWVTPTDGEWVGDGRELAGEIEVALCGSHGPTRQPVGEASPARPAGAVPLEQSMHCEGMTEVMDSRKPPGSGSDTASAKLVANILGEPLSRKGSPLPLPFESTGEFLKGGSRCA